MKRVHVYYRDMGLYRNEYVITLENNEFESSMPKKITRPLNFPETVGVWS